MLCIATYIAPYMPKCLNMPRAGAVKPCHTLLPKAEENMESLWRSICCSPLKFMSNMSMRQQQGRKLA